VVEDNPGDARLLREMFEDADPGGTELTKVSSMAIAEQHLAEHQVDAVLLDLGLPDAQGLDAVHRAHMAAPGTPLVVLTGLDDEALAIQALHQGAQDYLIKGQIEARGLVRALRYAIERKRLEDARKIGESELLQAQKLESIGRLAGGIAHDFNNMLFAIQGYGELLVAELGPSNLGSLDRGELLLGANAIIAASHRAAALTAQLLAFSRQQVVTLKVLDLNTSIAAIEPMVRQLIGKWVRLNISLDPAAGRIRADPGQIDQILVNLVVNARDAMPSGGTVTIDTGNATFDDLSGHLEVAPGSYVYLSVSDTGVGMDRKTRDHIFEPFFTTKDVGSGTGLGLATTHGIVHHAGGHIWVYSEPGQGSTFKLFFPGVEAGVEEVVPHAVAVSVGTGRVLVVEDEPSIRDVITRILERAGYAVHAVASGADAIEAARAGEPFDVLVTDVVMPTGSGLVLAEQMMDAYPTLGVVLLSGHHSESLNLERITARGARFTSKPVTSSQLLLTLQRAPGLRRAAIDDA
jgi:signal transduction histidine kinase